MKIAFSIFFIILITMLLIDAVWLSIMLKRLYTPNVGHLFKSPISILPAVIFYILYASAFTFLIVLPAFKNNINLLELIIRSFVFGVVTYGTYDLTNQVTLKGWPWIVTIVDIFWGGTLASLSATISFLLTKIIIR